MLHLPASESKFNCSKKETWSIPGPATHPLSCPRVSGRCQGRRSLPWCAWVRAPDGHLAVCYLPPRACCKKSLPCNISCTHLEAVKPGQTWFSLPAQPQLPWLNTGTTGGAPGCPQGAAPSTPQPSQAEKRGGKSQSLSLTKPDGLWFPQNKPAPQARHKEGATCQKGIAGFPLWRGG